MCVTTWSTSVRHTDDLDIEIQKQKKAPSNEVKTFAAELKEQLIKLAEDDKRSLNTKCEMMLESQIALEKQKNGEKK